MRMSFNVQMTGLRQAENKTKEQAKKVLWRAMNKMQEIAIRKVPVDTGKLRSSIILTPNFVGATAYTLADGVDYGIHVEYGTKPHYVPITPIKGWSRRVLGSESAAYAVSGKIAKFGTPASPFFRPSLFEVKNIWLPIFWKEAMS